MFRVILYLEACVCYCLYIVKFKVLSIAPVLKPSYRKLSYCLKIVRIDVPNALPSLLYQNLTFQVS